MNTLLSLFQTMLERAKNKGIEQIKKKRRNNMKNLMEDVAKLLGVELGEEFEIKGNAFNPHKITNEGLLDHYGNNVPVTFRELLLGKFKIIKPLLTQEEKEYLESVLRPYKEDVTEIRKTQNSSGEFISIIFYRGGEYERTELPLIRYSDFKFKGLALRNQYTIQALSLFEGEI